MPGLGDTIGRLKRERRPEMQLRDGEVLEEVRGFGFNPGGLRMLAHIPPGLPARAPLVVVLHGCTQRAASYARSSGWRELADRVGFALLAPEQTPANNPNRCFNWFEPGDVARDGGEAASIHAMTQHMLRTHDLDRERVFITGLSAGGAMTAVLLATYPETFAAGAVVAGVAFGLAASTSEAFAAMRSGSPLSDAQLGALVARAAPAAPRLPRLSIWHGAADGTVAPANGEILARQWAALHQRTGRADEVAAFGTSTRSIWRGEDGQALVELNLVAGLGHGVPLSAGGADPLGEVAPFMLEAGISSSLEIARFWDLVGAGDVRDGRPSGESLAIDPPAASLGADVLGKVSPYVSADISKVIRDALAAAGLMR